MMIISKPLVVEAVTVEPEESVVQCNTSMDIRTYASCIVTEKWGANHVDSFNNIIKSESGWCHTRWNGQLGNCPDVARKVKIPGASNAQGLCQTMLSVHGLMTDYDFMNNPYRQIDWCVDYTDDRYDNPNNAWSKWKVQKWW